jgi:hypothetical protein
MEMHLQHKKPTRVAVLLLVLLAVFTVSLITVKHLLVIQPDDELHLFYPQPPLLTEASKFPCLDSRPHRGSKQRFATLQGPDWKIESAIYPMCLPERELVFTTEEGRGFLPHALVRNARFWMTRRGDLIYVKVLGSLGSDQMDTTALELVSNRKCKKMGSRNCRVESAIRNPRLRID